MKDGLREVPWTAWLLLTLIVIDRAISVAFGFKPDWIDYAIDLPIIVFSIALILTGSRAVWSIMTTYSLWAMASAIYMLLTGPVRLEELSDTSVVHIVLGCVILALLVANPQLLRWVWKDRPETQT